MGDGDLGATVAIVAIFLFVGALLPYVHMAFGSSYTDFGFGRLQASIGLIEESDLSGLSSTFSGFDLLANIVLMFFWSFSLPWWLELFFLLLRIVLIVLIVRLARGVG